VRGERGYRARARAEEERETSETNLLVIGVFRFVGVVGDVRVVGGIGVSVEVAVRVGKGVLS